MVTIDNPASKLKYKSSKEVFLTVCLTLKYPTSWADAGHEVAWTQHQLRSSAISSTQVRSVLDRLSSEIQVSSTASLFKVCGDNFAFIFDRARGGLKTWIANNKMLLNADPRSGVAITPSFWRPATDNDVPVSLPYWKRFGVHVLTSQLRSLSIDASSLDVITLKVHTFIAPPVLAWGWDCETEYSVTNTGVFRINVTRLTPTGSFPEHVPRIGLNLCLRRDLNHVPLVRTWSR